MTDLWFISCIGLSVILTSLICLHLSIKNVQKVTKLTEKYGQEIEIIAYRNIISVCDSNPTATGLELSKLLNKLLMVKQFKITDDLNNIKLKGEDN